MEPPCSKGCQALRRRRVWQVAGLALTTMSSSGDVTRLLQRWGEGDPQAIGELLPLLHAALSLSPATIKREWATARAWLYRRLSDRRLAG